MKEDVDGISSSFFSSCGHDEYLSRRLIGVTGPRFALEMTLGRNDADADTNGLEEEQLPSAGDTLLRQIVLLRLLIALNERLSLLLRNETPSASFLLLPSPLP